MYSQHLFKTYCRSGKQKSSPQSLQNFLEVDLPLCVCVCVCSFSAVIQCPGETAISISLIKYKSSVIQLIYLALSPAIVLLFLPQLQVFDANKDGRLQLSEMAK